MNKNNVIYPLLSLSPYGAVLFGMYFLNNAFAAILVYHAGIITAVIFYRKQLDLKKIFHLSNIKLFFGLTAICLLSGTIVFLLWDLVKIETLNLQDTLTHFGFNSVNIWIFLIYFSTVHPVLEELFWRVIPKDEFTYFSVFDFIFAGYHILVLRFFLKPFWIAVCFLGLVIISMIWRYIQKRLNDTATVVITHAVADLSIFSAVTILFYN
jgi:hypothetical protein